MLIFILPGFETSRQFNQEMQILTEISWLPLALEWLDNLIRVFLQGVKIQSYKG